MRVAFTVVAELERSEGKFESRATLEGAIVEWLEAANEGSITGENEGTYDVVDWLVEVDA